VFGYKLCMILVTVCISLLYATLYFSEFGGKVNMPVDERSSRV
jgi:hypothetical protein